MKTDDTESALQTSVDQFVLPYAGVGSRISAALLDLFACYLLFLVALAGVFAITGDPTSGISSSILWFLGFSIAWLYFAGFEASAARATPGKRHARIVVTDAHGARISFGRASLRFLGKLTLLATGGLALLLISFDRHRRALDDLIAGTRVHSVEATVGGGRRPLWRKALGPVILVAVLGFLAKIAIDAQNDFPQRARVAELLLAVRSGLQAPYGAYYQANRRIPKISDLPFSHPQVQTAEIDAGGTLVVRLTQPSGAVLRLKPIFGENGAVTWVCRADAEQIVLFPADCRP